jgi:hypothetical protein
MLDQARRNVPEATFLHRDIIDADATVGHFDAVVAFFSLLMLPRDRIVGVLNDLKNVIGLGWPRDQLKHVVVTAAGFAIEMEDVRSYAPPTPEVPPETQLFVLARRT